MSLDVTTPAAIEVGELIASFVVHGQPAPQGSKKGFVNPKTGRVVVVEQLDARIKTWRGGVERAAWEIARCNCGERGCSSMRPGFPVDAPVIARMVFSFRRPASHYRTGRNSHLLRDAAPSRPLSPPDVSKLARATEDALKIAGIYKDDSRIVDYTRLAKVWCDEDPESLPIPGARLSFWRLPSIAREEVRPPLIQDIDQMSLEALFSDPEE